MVINITIISKFFKFSLKKKLILQVLEIISIAVECMSVKRFFFFFLREKRLVLYGKKIETKLCGKIRRA